MPSITEGHSDVQNQAFGFITSLEGLHEVTGEGRAKHCDAFLEERQIGISELGRGVSEIERTRDREGRRRDFNEVSPALHQRMVLGTPLGAM